MNTNPTTPTAAELLAEWKKPVSGLRIENTLEWLSQHTFIGLRLDKMCDEIGISVVNGSFVYAKCLNGDGVYRGWYGVVNPTDWVRIPAQEQQDLQEWLLIRKNQ